MKTQFKPRQEYAWLRRSRISRFRAGFIVARRWWLYRQCEKVRRARNT